jgi:integrase
VRIGIVCNGKTRREVQEKLHAALNEQKQGMLTTGPKQTVKDYLNYWLEIHSAKLKISTYALYKGHLDTHIIPALGHIQLQKLTVDQVQAFYTKLLKNELSAGTVRVIHAILFVALKDAVKWKRLAVNVCTAVTLPRLAQRERQPLTKEQALQLLEAAKGNRLECLLTLALATGMRLGEILALRWDDINLEERTLRVAHTARYVSGFGMIESEPKTESSRRSIILPQFVMDILKQHRAYQLETRLKAGAAWQEHGLVFPNTYGRYLSRTTLYSFFKKLLREAGLSDMHFHDLRHSAATILLSMGVPAKVVQQILGHRNISTTLNIYGHVLPEMQRDAMDDMDDFLRGRK